VTTRRQQPAKPVRSLTAGAENQGTGVGTLSVHITAYITERTALGRFTGTGPVVARHHLASLNRWHGDRALNRLTRDSIIAWMDSISDKAASTRHSYLSAAAGLTHWMVSRGIITDDPCEGVERPKIPQSVPRALGPTRITACLDACTDDRDRAVIWLGVGMGLRRAEIANVRWSDYDDHEQTLRVKGKGGHTRLLPVPADVASALARIRGPQSSPVIPRYSGAPGPLNVRSISLIVNRVMRDAGVKVAAFDGVGVHSLRHTAASDVLKKSGNLQAVQVMLGHTNLATTARYLRVTGVDDLRVAMEGRNYSAPHLRSVVDRAA
jgi:site-specific recombinase XerC